MMGRERALVKVATAEGHAAFWYDEVTTIVDTSKGASITLNPYPGTSGPRGIESAWSTERVLKAIEEATGPPNTRIQYVLRTQDGEFRDLMTGVKVEPPR